MTALIFAVMVLTWPAQPQNVEVDLALVIALDVSYSVDSTEHRLQMLGFAKAMRSQDVHDAIAAGPNQKIALAVFQWSDGDKQNTLIPWTILHTREDAIAIAEILERGQRTAAEGGTNVSAALIYGATLMETAPSAFRRVIDVSTDGRNNTGIPVPRARDRVVAQGITINGLAILNEWPELVRYIERQVIGGNASFVEAAKDYSDFENAMLRKLVKEILGPGVI